MAELNELLSRIMLVKCRPTESRMRKLEHVGLCQVACVQYVDAYCCLF